MNGMYQYIAGVLKWGSGATVAKQTVIAKQSVVKGPVQRSLLRRIRTEDDFVKFQMSWIL